MHSEYVGCKFNYLGKRYIILRTTEAGFVIQNQILSYKQEEALSFDTFFKEVRNVDTRY